MKAALCFLISYDHVLNKEHLWREWIEPNQDILNIYFFYKDFTKIQSPWIRQHALPPERIVETSYFQVVPAYLSVLQFAYHHDPRNQWFCMLTDACCPIISPKRFRYLFLHNSKRTLLNWRTAWWNVDLQKRSNLRRLPKELHLANDPWFVLTRRHVESIYRFVQRYAMMSKIVCDGGLANESLFAIALSVTGQLKEEVDATVTHLTDWKRMSSTTSPHVFQNPPNDRDIEFIENALKEHKMAMFMRKVAKDFPDEILRHYIYEHNRAQDDALCIPFQYSWMAPYIACGVFILFLLNILFLPKEG